MASLLTSSLFLLIYSVACFIGPFILPYGMLAETPLSQSRMPINGIIWHGPTRAHFSGTVNAVTFKNRNWEYQTKLTVGGESSGNKWREKGARQGKRIVEGPLAGQCLEGSEIGTRQVLTRDILKKLRRTAEHCHHISLIYQLRAQAFIMVVVWQDVKLLWLGHVDMVFYLLLVIEVGSGILRLSPHLLTLCSRLWIT